MILQFGLKSLAVPWVIVPACLAGGFNIYDRSQPWRGEWVWSIDWAGTSLLIIGPIAAGIAALDSARLREIGRIGLIETAARPYRARLLVYIYVAVSATLGYLTTLGILICISNPHTSMDLGLGFLAILAQVTGILFYSALGVTVGRLAGPLAAPPAAVVAAVFCFWAFGRADTDFSPLNFGGATSTLIAFEYDARYLTLQIVSLVCLVALLLLLGVRLNSRDQGNAPTGRILSGIALVAICLIVASAGIKVDRLVQRSDLRATSCAGDRPVICVYPEHSRFLPGVASPMARLYKGADTLKISNFLPSSLRERLPNEGAAEDGLGRLEILPDAFSAGTIEPHALATSLVLPWHCAELFGDTPPAEGFSERLETVVTALLAASGYDSRDKSLPGAAASPGSLGSILSEFSQCRLGK